MDIVKLAHNIYSNYWCRSLFLNSKIKELRDVNFIYIYSCISKNPNVTIETVLENPDKPWNFYTITLNPNITWNIVSSNPDKNWNYSYLSENPNITWDIVRDNPDIPWSIDTTPKNQKNIKSNENLRL